MTEVSDIGLVGLAVMGQNLALNIVDHGFSISVFNRTASKTGPQRDSFGSHTYERTDTPQGEYFHLDWVGNGEETPA